MFQRGMRTRIGQSATSSCSNDVSSNVPERPAVTEVLR